MTEAAQAAEVEKPEKIIPAYMTSKGAERLRMLRAQLLTVAVQFVLTESDGTRSDRLRAASDLSGIPINFIEIALERRGKQ